MEAYLNISFFFMLEHVIHSAEQLIVFIATDHFCFPVRILIPWKFPAASETYFQLQNFTPRKQNGEYFKQGNLMALHSKKILNF